LNTERHTYRIKKANTALFTKVVGIDASAREWGIAAVLLGINGDFISSHLFRDGTELPEFIKSLENTFVAVEDSRINGVFNEKIRGRMAVMKKTVRNYSSLRDSIVSDLGMNRYSVSLIEAYTEKYIGKGAFHSITPKMKGKKMTPEYFERLYGLKTDCQDVIDAYFVAKAFLNYGLYKT